MPIASFTHHDADILHDDHAPFDLQDDLADIDDATLEQALKSVSWNGRDVGQYLRAYRAH